MNFKLDCPQIDIDNIIKIGKYKSYTDKYGYTSFRYLGRMHREEEAAVVKWEYTDSFKLRFIKKEWWIHGINFTIMYNEVI